MDKTRKYWKVGFSYDTKMANDSYYIVGMQSINTERASLIIFFLIFYKRGNGVEMYFFLLTSLCTALYSHSLHLQGSLEVPDHDGLHKGVQKWASTERPQLV